MPGCPSNPGSAAIAATRTATRNGRLNDNLTDGSFGTPKRVLSLLGVKDTGPWAWNGHMKDLETQVRTSLKSTMQGPTPTADR